MKITGTKHRKATAYHPQANGMVERFHRQLKTAIKCHETDSWTEVLPIILLGIKASFKEDLAATSADLIFGETICLPGQFFGQDNNDEWNKEDFVGKLRRWISKLSLRLKRYGEKNIFVYRDLKEALDVFLRHDAPTEILYPRYDRPYEVVKRNDEFYTIKIGDKSTTVSLERIKPAYLFSENFEEKEEIPSSNKPQAPEKRNPRIRKPIVRFQAEL
ncbi:uncharacterized protein LOC105837101 [Monomorium pharaonis]|uniref:uncharacterized protein LOC105837101 n=1 Tax=Monomorium pharaonis TaxID=307658 RepID=UPI00063FA4B6|nr:uncharacterized protein LOC105837101 [Monomorium pharaonis]